MSARKKETRQWEGGISCDLEQWEATIYCARRSSARSKNHRPLDFLQQFRILSPLPPLPRRPSRPLLCPVYQSTQCAPVILFLFHLQSTWFTAMRFIINRRIKWNWPTFADQFSRKIFNFDNFIRPLDSRLARRGPREPAALLSVYRLYPPWLTRNDLYLLTERCNQCARLIIARKLNGKVLALLADDRLAGRRAYGSMDDGIMVNFWWQNRGRV